MNPYFVSRKVCPCCSSPESGEIYRNPFTESPVRDYLEAFYNAQGRIEFDYLEGAQYTLIECRRCGLVFQQEVPGNELAAILYERWIDPGIAMRQYEDRTGLAFYAEHAENVMRLIAYFGVKPSSLSFLDFGMGWGKWALMVKAFGCASYGLDLSSARTTRAQSAGVTILGRKDLDGRQFDFVSADWVFEHIPDPFETLVELREVLKANGVLRISVPIVRDIGRRLKVMDWNAAKDARDSLNAVAPLEHINCFRRETLLEMASAAGMREVFIPVDRRYQLAKRLSTLRRLAKNIVLPILPGLARDYVFLGKPRRTP